LAGIRSILLHEMPLMSRLAGDVVASEEELSCVELVRSLFRRPVHWNGWIFKKSYYTNI